MNSYVSNLNFRTRGESLQTLFGEYGEVSSANIITDRETGRSKGFGFVERVNAEVAQAATAPRATAPANAPTWAMATVATAVAATEPDSSL